MYHGNLVENVIAK